MKQPCVAFPHISKSYLIVESKLFLKHVNKNLNISKLLKPRVAHVYFWFQINWLCNITCSTSAITTCTDVAAYLEHVEALTRVWMGFQNLLEKTCQQFSIYPEPNLLSSDWLTQYCCHLRSRTICIQNKLLKCCMRQCKKIKSYCSGITPKHLTSGEAHLRILALEQHSY